MANRRTTLRVLLSLSAVIGTVVLAAHLVPLPERLGACPSRMVLYRDGSPAHLFLSCDDKWRLNLTVADTDPRYIDALLRFEDRRFWWHPGVDPAALVRAMVQNMRAGHVVSGGSTITMQVVRVLEPRPRTLFSKAVEALRALQLELRFSKREILGLYLRHAPFGRNIEGVAAASLGYFGHLPSALSFHETAVLLAIPQDPTKRFPQAENRERLQNAANGIARRMNGWKIFRKETNLNESVPIPQDLRSFPREIPHAALWLAAKFPERELIRTALDAGTQTFAETVFENQRASLATQAVNNGSLVIVDSKSGEVRAAVGNFDFWDEAHGGQIAGFAIPRSPGSALKPVLYAMALDRGLLLPSSLVPDVPTKFPGYAPRNFDEKFTGLVRFDEALAQSLNLPFVNLLQRIGVEEFLTALRRMGVRSLDPQPGKYGLSAIVGGLELTPEELAGIYATLARNGVWRPLRWLKSDRGESRDSHESRDSRDAREVEVFDSGASWLTRQTLALRDRPDFPNRRSINDTSRNLHWKTGTSFGQRDAWAAGFGTTYTVVVWLGNFDNSPSAALVGAESAAPILFDVLEGLDGNELSDAAESPPANVIETEVCAFSGMPANHACEQKKMVSALRDKLPASVCPYHVTVDVDALTKRALTPMCRVGRRFETRTFVQLPLEMRRWLADTSQNLPAPPPLAQFCAKVQSLQTPKIVSPLENQTILLMAGVASADQKIGLEADLPSETNDASWFVDGKFLGTTAGHERLWWTPEVGEHEIVLTDETGLLASRKIRVKGP